MNKKRYWLRGGITIGGIYALLFIVYVLLAYSSEARNAAYAPGGAGLGLALIPIVLSGIPSTLFLEGIVRLLPSSFEHSTIGPLLLLFVFCVAQYFIVGSILGWLYGKIKNRNSSSPQV